MELSLSATSSIPQSIVWKIRRYTDEENRQGVLAACRAYPLPTIGDGIYFGVFHRIRFKRCTKQSYEDEHIICDGQEANNL